VGSSRHDKTAALNFRGPLSLGPGGASRENE